MKAGGFKRLALLSVGASVLLPAVLFHRFPESVPVHWNWQGQIDAYAQRAVGAFLMPAITLFVYLLLLLLPRIAPREFSSPAMEEIYSRVSLSLISLMFLLSALITLVAAGMPAHHVRYPLALLGTGLIAFGYRLARRSSGASAGTRDLLLRTSRLSGRLLLAAGAFTLTGAALGSSLFPAMAAGSVALMLPLAYSFIICWGESDPSAPGG